VDNHERMLGVSQPQTPYNQKATKRRAERLDMALHLS